MCLQLVFNLVDTFGVSVRVMSISPAMQRYAAEIYRLQQDHEQVSLSLVKFPCGIVCAGDFHDGETPQ